MPLLLDQALQPQPYLRKPRQNSKWKLPSTDLLLVHLYDFHDSPLLHLVLTVNILFRLNILFSIVYELGAPGWDLVFFFLVFP